MITRTRQPLITHPPTFASLIDDRSYRKYMKTIPSLPQNLLTIGKPWAVWAITVTGKWRGGMFATYSEAWSATLRAYRDIEKYHDVSLTSRRHLFAQPPNLAHMMDYPFEWCGRCRRPTLFQPFNRHHSLAILTTTDNERCYYCGIRRSFV